jgi:D-aspartate ligase
MAATAVIIGADINGLGVVRSLAREGVPTMLVDRDLRHPSMRSRHGTKVVFAALERAPLVDSLLRLRERFADDPVLFLTQERAVETVAANLDRLASAYRFTMPEPSLMRTLMDKSGFQALAQEHGFPIPRALSLHGEADLPAAAELTYPCVLKPLVKTPAYDQRFKKGYKIENTAQLRQILGDIGDAADMILQEWIEGGDELIYFCLQFRGRDQRRRATFTGRKLRSWPPKVGGTASCVPEYAHAAELQELTEAFFAKVGFCGLGSMEYKQDARTGRFMMIEPTVGRTDFQEEIATLNGVNIPYAAYCYETGQDKVANGPARPPAAWAVSPIDKWSSELQPETPRGFPKGHRRYDALWRLDDPAPWCYETAKSLRSRLKRLMTSSP